MRIINTKNKKYESKLNSYFDIPLYFKCNGIFTDSFVGDHLPIDNSKAFTGNKFIDSYWNSDSNEFDKFFLRISDIFNNYYPICKSWNEYQLEDKFIKEILSALGYSYHVQTTIEQDGKINRPDYLLFYNENDYHLANKLQLKDKGKFFEKAMSVADAKAWNTDLDKEGGFQNSPAIQIIRYLDATIKDWGIVTNGRQWRLYYRNIQDRSLKFFEIDLERVFQSQFKYDRAKYFFYFFRNKAIFKDFKGICFLDEVMKNSESYAIRVSSNIKQKIIKISPNITAEIFSKMKNSITLKDAFKYSLYYCFRIIFILAAESRNILDISIHSKYHSLSLRKIAFDLRESWLNDEKWSQEHYNTYEKLKNLYKVLDQGDTFLGLIGFNSNAYINCDSEIFNKINISDYIINNLIFELAFENEENKKKLFVDYKRISPEHIGGIFESIIEFNPKIISKNEVVLVSSTDRKDSGSYYTPECVVDYLLLRSLSEININANIKILDPACGSGHFLIGAIRSLSSYISEIEKNDNINMEDLRNHIAERNIFGIDKNEIAVALSKLSIYLTVMRRDKPLPNIDNNIKCIDSLRDNINHKWINSFDLVIGNPPYVNTKILSKSDSNLKDFLTHSNAYETCKGCFDLYIPFIERSYKEFVKNGGIISLILPNKLMVANYANEIRFLIEKYSEKITVIDVSNFDVFTKIGVYPHLYFFKRRKNEELSVKFTLENANLTNTNNSEFFWIKTQIINEKLKLPSNEIWSAQKKRGIGLSNLSDICDIEGGVTGYQAQEVLSAIVDGKKDRTVIPFVVSGNIKKGHIHFGGVRYMKHDFFMPYLKVNSNIISDGKKSLFINKKIVIPGMTKEIRSCFVNSPLAVGVGVFSIKAAKIDLEVIAAILNSLAFTYLYREKFEAKHLAGGYLAINASQLKNADFPSNISSNDIKNLKIYYKKMTLEKMSLEDRIEFEKLCAELMGVKIKKISELKFYDNNSKEIITYFKGAA